nr:hypothetical protein [Cytophagales bacterium]
MNLKEISLFLTEPIVLIPEPKTVLRSDEMTASKSSLASVSEETKTNPQKTVEDIPDMDTAVYKGNFQKGLLVLHQGNTLSEESQRFLMTILKAVNHSLKDIALLSEADLLVGHPDSITHLNPTSILIFGKLAHPVMQRKKSDYTIFQDEHTMLFADDLEELEKNKLLKKKLWTALQALFNINS